MLITDLFKVYDNGLLDRVQQSGRGAKIGKIGIEAPVCADDTTYLSNDAESLQFLINISKDSSDMDGYILQEIKSVVLKMDSIKNYPEGETWKIGDKDMPVFEQTTYMGIPRSSSAQEMHAVETNIQKVSKCAKIRSRYNQVPLPTQDTNGKVTNSQLDTTNESQEVSVQCIVYMAKKDSTLEPPSPYCKHMCFLSYIMELKL